MPAFNGALPILPGKLDVARAFAEEMIGERKAGYTKRKKRSGMKRETWTIQEMPAGHVVLIWFECKDPDGEWIALATDDSEFGIWFRKKVKEITGVSLTGPVEGRERILDWRA